MTDRGVTSNEQPADEHRADAQLSAAAGRQRSVLGTSLALFLVTFLVYWLGGPQQTAFDFQLSQANNIIHGQLHLTEEYTRNLNILERVLFDGEGFCLPVDDPRGAEHAADFEDPRITADCRHYMQHSLGPAFLLVPLVMIWGLDANQALVSALIGALTAPLVFGVVRRFTDHRRTQLALTVLAMFGTQIWYSAADGGVWHFAHTTAFFFVVASIYATVVLRSPLLAGAFVGAALMCRPTTALAGLFPLIVFSEQWFVQAVDGPLWRRIRLRPLVELAAGAAPFVFATGTVNMLRFNNPFESGYNYTEQLYQVSLSWRWPHGFFDLSYIGRHVEVVFEQMPVLATVPSYIWPSWAGLAMWVVTPPIFYALFIHLRRWRREALLAAGSIAVACAFIFLRGAARSLGGPGWLVDHVPLDLHLVPFWTLIGIAIVTAIGARDRLVIACWAAIAGISLVVFMFAATGWSQFGYRYALDFLPFLWLLVVVAVGRRMRWYHAALIAAGVVVNLWGVLWIYQFGPQNLFGWTWVSF